LIEVSTWLWEVFTNQKVAAWLREIFTNQRKATWLWEWEIFTNPTFAIFSVSDETWCYFFLQNSKL